MFIWDWFSGLLSYLGLSRKNGKLIFLGLENAGKTSLLGMIKTGRLVQSAPTWLPNSEELALEGMKFTTYDLGGHEQARRVWRDYFPAVDGIVFLIDSSDSDTFTLAKAELQGLLSDKDICKCPILVLGNKIDKSNALNEVELKRTFHLDGLSTGKGSISINDLGGQRPLEVFMCSIPNKQGYGEAFRWLAQYI